METGEESGARERQGDLRSSKPDVLRSDCVSLPLYGHHELRSLILADESQEEHGNNHINLVRVRQEKGRFITPYLAGSPLLSRRFQLTSFPQLIYLTPAFKILPRTSTSPSSLGA